MSLIEFHRDSFQFEWPALKLDDKVFWLKRHDNTVQLEIPDPVRVTIVSSLIQSEGFEDCKSDENAGSASKIDSQASQ